MYIAAEPSLSPAQFPGATNEVTMRPGQLRGIHAIQQMIATTTKTATAARMPVGSAKTTRKRADSASLNDATGPPAERIAVLTAPSAATCAPQCEQKGPAGESGELQFWQNLARALKLLSDYRNCCKIVGQPRTLLRNCRTRNLLHVWMLSILRRPASDRARPLRAGGCRTDRRTWHPSPM